MKIGDAQCEVWFEGRNGRSYCCTVESVRRGTYGSPEWLRPVFRWSLEAWLNNEGPESRYATDGEAKTFNAALNRASAAAHEIERRLS